MLQRFAPVFDTYRRLFQLGLFLFEQNIVADCDELQLHPREREGERETAIKPQSRRLLLFSPSHRFRERIGSCSMCVTYPTYTFHSTCALHTIVRFLVCCPRLRI
jgi:hypothetical protein